MRTFRGIAVTLAAGAAVVSVLAGCGGSDGKKDDQAGGQPSDAPTSSTPTSNAPTSPTSTSDTPTSQAADDCPSDHTILTYVQQVTGSSTFPKNERVETKTCKVGWVVARIVLAGTDPAILAAKVDGSEAHYGSAPCQNPPDFPAEIRALLHC
jgi:hypothetical protein